MVVVTDKKILVFEMSCPFDTRIKEKEKEKKNKYDRNFLKFLRTNINQLLNKNYEIELIPIIIGALGLYDNELSTILKLHIKKKNIHTKLQKSVLNNSAQILHKCN